jgi:hypothetical protein
MCLMYVLYLPVPHCFLLAACDCSLRCVVSCFILCVLPPGVYTVYYLKYWAVSLVMHVIHMDSFFTDFIYVLSF